MFIKYPILDKYELQVLTTTSSGGVSQGNYESMNLCTHSGDSLSNVEENRSRLAKHFGVDDTCLFIPYQTHQDKVKVIDQKFLKLSKDEQSSELYGIDALITKERRVVIGITTADCVPIVMYDSINHALGVVHAGWKGTVSHIGAKTVRKMAEIFSSHPSDLKVVIGPSISQEMFEVGDEVGDVFANAGFILEDISIRKPETGKLHIDLWKANLLSLIEEGLLLDNIKISGICTYKSPEFFSARRQTIMSGRIFTGGLLK